MYYCFSLRQYKHLSVVCWVFLLKRHSWWQVLKLLAGPFLRQHANYQQRIIVLLLDHVIILPAQRKLSMAALKALKKQDVPELSGNSRPQSVLLFSSKRLHFLATLSAIIFCIAPQRLLFAGLQDVESELPDKSPLKPAGAASDSSIADREPSAWLSATSTACRLLGS